jgi:hypothetical protein
MEEDGHVYELSCLTFNINKEVIQVLDSFLSFLKNMKKELEKLLKGTKLWSCKFGTNFPQVSMYFKVKILF